MPTLQEKIKRLEKEIQTDRSALYQNGILLKEKIKAPEFLYPLIVVSFIVGYVIVHKNSNDNEASSTSKLTSLLKNLQLFLPLIYK